MHSNVKIIPEQIMKVKTLKLLNLMDTEVSEESIKYLKKNMPWCNILSNY